MWFNKLMPATLILIILGLAACSETSVDKKGFKGTFSADYSVNADGSRTSFVNPASSMKITFNQSKASLEYAAFGRENSADLIVSYAGNKATVFQKGKEKESVVFVIKGNALECVKCPPTIPTVWRKEK
jgi:hypothetical protein